MADGDLKKTGVQLSAEGAEKFKSDVQGANDAVQKFGKGAEDAAKGIDVLGEMATGALRRLGELAIEGFGSLIGALGDFTQEAMKAEVQLAEIGAVLVSTNGQAGLTMEGVRDLAMQYRDLVDGADDAVLAIEKIGIQAGSITKDAMPQFIEDAANLGQLMGSDTAAATLLARANEDVSGAMGRAVRAGVLFSDSLKQQIKDLDASGNSAEALRLFMGRISQATAGQAAAAADTLSGRLTILRNHLDDIGKGAVESFTPGMQAIVEAIQGPLEAAAEGAAVWGQNIISQLANGMLAAAVEVVQALTNIGGIISFWLAPGSPPNLLPRIDQWGTAAMTEFVQGFGKADFSVMNDISGQIERALRSASTLSGSKSDTGLVPAIIGERSAVAQALGELDRAGKVSAATMAAVKAGLANASPDLLKYVELTFDLHTANKAVADAQEQLTRITKQYDDQLNAAQRTTLGITNAQQDLQDAQRISALQLVEQDPNATLAEKQMARLEIERLGANKRTRDLEAEKKVAVDTAQAKLDKEQEHQLAIQGQVETQKMLLDMQDKQNQLLTEQLNLIQKIADEAQRQAEKADKPATGGGPAKPPIKGGGGGGGLIPDPEAVRDALLAPVRAALAELQGKLAELQGVWQTVWANITATLAPALLKFDEVKLAFGNLVTAFTESGPQIQQIIGEVVAFIVDEMGISLPHVFETVKRLLDGLAEFWRIWGSHILNVVEDALLLVGLAINLALITISHIVRIVMDLIQGNWKQAWADILEYGKTISDAVLRMLGLKLTNLQAAFAQAFDNVYNTAKAWFKQVWDFIHERIAHFKMLGEDLMRGLSDGIQAGIGWVLDSTKQAIQGAIDAAKHILNIKSPSRVFMEIGGFIMEGMAAGIEALSQRPVQALGEAISAIMPPSANQGIGSYSSTRTYAPQFNYSPTYVGNAAPPSENFGVMQAMFG